MEFVVEVGHHAGPLDFALGYVIETFLDVGREVEIDDSGEVFLQEFVHDCAHVGGYELAFVGSGSLGARGRGNIALSEGKCVYGALFARVVAFLHIFALLDSGYGGGVGRRAAYAEFFHFFTSDASV